MTQDALSCVLRYHEETKHHLNRYARSLGYMDWATQPNPFRQFEGAPQLPLDHPALSATPSYDSLFACDAIASEPLNRPSISRLFYDSLAISAWKQAPGTAPWSLRINPSSGCLHPTEGYLVAGPIDGLSAQAGVYHYSPYLHALEQRTVLARSEWERIAEQLPRSSILVALTSIYWRESWKYGERAFRYCHHDVGHAIGTIAIAAASLGWQTRLITSLGDDDLSVLLGVHPQRGIEAEHPDCLMSVSPPSGGERNQQVELQLHASLLEQLASREFAGSPNRLSRDHHPWPIIDEVAEATRFRSGTRDEGRPCQGRVQWGDSFDGLFKDRAVSAQQMIRQRRSALRLDGRTPIDRDDFFRMLLRVTPGAFPLPFAVFPWRPRVSLALLVHRVEGLAPGLYVQVRHASHEQSLRDNLRDDFAWRKPPGCPSDLGVWLLREASCQQTAMVINCHQEIAADGAFSLGMLAEFEPSLHAHGASFYPRLFWETGLIGQVLYLEAEASGLRATGIGCFFDDALHEILGLQNLNWQSLYHFTTGGTEQDLRILTLPPYAHLQRT